MAGTMSVRKAAAEYGVPQSTLHNKVTGKVALRVKSGSKNHLTDEEEASLVEFLVGSASIGYAKSQKDVLAIAQQILSARTVWRLQRGGGIPFDADNRKWHFDTLSHCHTPGLLQTIQR